MTVTASNVFIKIMKMTLATTVGAAFLLAIISTSVAASVNSGCSVKCTSSSQAKGRSLRQPLQRVSSYLYDTCNAHQFQATGTNNSTGKKADLDHSNSSRLCPITEVCTWNANQFPNQIIHHICTTSFGVIKKTDSVYTCVNQTRYIHVLEQTKLPCRNGNADLESLRWNQVKVYVGCAAKRQT